MNVSSAGIKAVDVWNVLVTSLGAVGSIGAVLDDLTAAKIAFIDAAITSRLTFTVYKYGPTNLATATNFIPPANTLAFYMVLEDATVDASGHFVWLDSEVNDNHLVGGFDIAESANKNGVVRMVLCDGTNQKVRNVTGDTKRLKIVGWTLV